MLCVTTALKYVIVIYVTFELNFKPADRVVASVFYSFLHDFRKASSLPGIYYSQNRVITPQYLEALFIVHIIKFTNTLFGI